MTGEARRPYHHGNLRETLLHAAERLIESHGVHNLSVRELARDSGVSHTSAQRHFADKNALLIEVARRGFNRLGIAFREAGTEPTEEFGKRLSLLAQAHVDFALRHPAVMRWMFEAASWPDAPPALLMARDEALSPAGAILEAGQATGDVVEGAPERLGLASFAAIQGLVMMSVSGKFGGHPLDALVSEVIERIILGLKPR